MRKLSRFQQYCFLVAGLLAFAVLVGSPFFALPNDVRCQSIQTFFDFTEILACIDSETNGCSGSGDGPGSSHNHKCFLEGRLAGGGFEDQWCDCKHMGGCESIPIEDCAEANAIIDEYTAGVTLQTWGETGYGGCPGGTTIGLSQSSGDPGKSFFSKGQEYFGVSKTPLQFSAQYSAGWGVGGESVTTSPLIGIRIGGTYPGNPQLSRIYVNAFSSSLASFGSIALNGGTTGTNSYSLEAYLTPEGPTSVPEQLYYNRGLVDTVSGDFVGRFRVFLINDHFPATAPARLIVNAWGNIDSETQILTFGFAATSWDDCDTCGL